MDKLKLFILNYKKYFVIFLCALFFSICGSIYYFNYSNKESLIDSNNDLVFNDIYTSSEYINDKNNDLELNEKKENIEIIEYISVDIKGKVRKPGVYKIEKRLDRRVSDIITMAGGTLNDADTSVTNLAKKIFDEMVIIIYSKSEVKEFSKVLEKENIENDICKKECDSCIEQENTINNSDNTNQNKEEIKLININQAEKDELMTLPGIGESKALAIIEYRKQTPFLKIEDIMNISGIKENAFEKIKDYITV